MANSLSGMEPHAESDAAGCHGDKQEQEAASVPLEHRKYDEGDKDVDEDEDDEIITETFEFDVDVETRTAVKALEQDTTTELTVIKEIQFDGSQEDPGSMKVDEDTLYIVEKKRNGLNYNIVPVEVNRQLQQDGVGVLNGGEQFRHFMLLFELKCFCIWGNWFAMQTSSKIYKTKTIGLV